MKRIACLMLVLSIACTGCKVNELVVPEALWNRINGLQTALESQHTELKGDITKLEEEELSQIKTGLKALQDKIIELETALESQHTELKGDINKKLEEELSQIKEALLARTNKLETDLGSQHTELKGDINKLEEELSQIKIALKPVKALPDRINKLETALGSQHTELRGDIKELKKATWWIWGAIATIIIALIAGGVAVHRSRKDTKIRKSNQDRQDPNSTDELPDKTTLLKATLPDLSDKNPGSLSEHEYTGLGLLGHWLSWILGTRFPREVRNDWLRVETMRRRIVERIFSEAKDTPIPPEKLNLLTISHDCLCAARKTHVLAEAWRYVNQASETLSQVATPEECSQLAERFLEWEPLLDRHLKNMYGKSLAQELKKHRNDAEAKETKESSAKIYAHLLHEIMKDICKESQVEKLEKNQKDAQECRAKICAHLLHEIMKDICKESQVEKLEELEKNRKDAEEDCPKIIRTHSRQWALINQANLFRICIIRNVTFVFLVSSAVMLLTTFLIMMRNPLGRPIRAPYHLCIAIYGWFGAALSILLGVRKLSLGAVNFRTLRSSLLLRLALGAGGAFVTYVVVRATGILNTSLLDSIPGFIALGIAGGFSELLFQRVLEMFTKRIVPSKNDKGSEKVD